MNNRLELMETALEQDAMLGEGLLTQASGLIVTQGGGLNPGDLQDKLGFTREQEEKTIEQLVNIGFLSSGKVDVKQKKSNASTSVRIMKKTVGKVMLNANKKS